MIIVWSIIVTFVTSIATLDQLIKLLPFLAPLKALPTWFVGLIQGIIPALAIAGLMALLPMILKWLLVFAGVPLKTEVQLGLMHLYFIFLV